MDATFADKVCKACLSYYAKLPSKGKPAKHEWTILACFVISDSSSKGTEIYPKVNMRESNFRLGIEVVSMGTGSKCVGRNGMGEGGDVLFDSHAEIIAKRSFQRFFFAFFLNYHFLIIYISIDIYINN